MEERKDTTVHLTITTVVFWPDRLISQGPMNLIYLTGGGKISSTISISIIDQVLDGLGAADTY